VPEPVVGIAAASLTGGGAERQAALWATALAAAGREVRVLTLLRTPNRYELPSNVSVETLGKTSAGDTFASVHAVRRLARSVDVVVAFQPYMGLLCMLARTSTPWMIVTGDDPRFWGHTSHVPAAAYRLTFRRAAAASAPTHGLVELYRQLHIGPSGPFLTIPNAVPDAAYTEPATERAGVLFVGRLVPEKRPLLAVEAARLSGLPLTILGEGPLAARCGGGARLMPFTSTPWDVYAQHRVLVLTSRYETFANVIAESLAAGTPAVAVDCDYGPREIIGGADYSVLVDDDPHALAAALKTVATRAPSAQERAECDRIAARYRLDALAPAFLGAIDALATGPVRA
jgi:glycosyltransferase involved in cell wall biosynthesis